MAIPIPYLIGGGLIAAAGGYELVTKVILKKKHHHDAGGAPPSDGTTPAATQPAAVDTSGASAGGAGGGGALPDASSGAPGYGPPSPGGMPGGMTSGGMAPYAPYGPSAPYAPPPVPVPPVSPITGRMGYAVDPAFLAQHPGWIGWRPGMPQPPAHRRRPRPPQLRQPVTPTGAAIVGGKPVMTGSPAEDMAHALSFHGYRKSDVPLYRRAQAQLGVPIDGLPGNATMSALSGYLAGRGIPMPSVPLYSFVAFDGHRGPTMQQWTATA